MDIQLKHIKFYRQLSKESLCFDAKVYVDGKWLLNCGNTGEGLQTTYELKYYHKKEFFEKLEEVEDYFNQMPDIKRTIPKELDPGENIYTVKMSLTEWIDTQIDEAWAKKNEKRLKQLELLKRERDRLKQLS